MIISTIIERDHLTVIEWRKKIVIGGSSPRAAEFLDYLDNQFMFPVAVKQTTPESTATFDLEAREVGNAFELATAALKMASELGLEIIITEEL